MVAERSEVKVPVTEERRAEERRVRAASDLLRAAENRGVTLAVAESLTGGQVASSLVEVPGASRVLVGAVVAYAVRVKAQVLGVDAAHLARTGPVDRDVALQMAHGVRRLLGADLGLATTGVAGPGPADGHPAGTVHIAVVGPGGEAHRELHLSGHRSQVRYEAVLNAIELASDFLRERS
ncbi:CinA family protein [Actinomyces viscosus]|uniref:Competence damage-inducible protein A n=1 Tax=Actinomyces viscosus TaxID=1656 RepID=A0A3S4VVB0_ACTVI|nr:nicotinamide-nucleotide amidohydrolase family protein [Actinomyces viscosus]TFH51097.1 CinA family protein [Actinomyces viscosus]VEI14487.1 competence damage-inducible protein A [Actinomyces viscosus]